MSRFLICALYRFTPLRADADLRDRIDALCDAEGVCGTLLLASEGLNGTLAGPEAAMRRVVDFLRSLPGCADLTPRESWSEERPFLRLKIRLKREIVTMGEPDLDPAGTGHYVEPEDWNDLISQPDVVTIDTRNGYEVRIGQFDGAVDPQTRSFRDFPDWFRQFRETRPDARIAMYCTGGIRCEKATAFVRREGIDDVFHLKGGILNYLERIPEADSLWRGECFVFDRRVAVRHGLEPGEHSTCHACREPLAPEHLASPLYREGEACPFCHDARDPDRRRGYAERERQEKLARARGDRHLGQRPDRAEP